MILTLPGRTDIEDLFKLSDLFDGEDNPHHPLLVFMQDKNRIAVNTVFNADDLLSDVNYKGEDWVLAQWEGKWRSDWFKFQVKDYREWYKRNYE